VSQERLLQWLHFRRSKHMLSREALWQYANCIFEICMRPLGAAFEKCWSNNCRRSKYRLHCLVRTNLMAEDAAYGAAQELEDSASIKGIKLSKDLPKIAGEKPGCTTVASIVWFQPTRHVCSHCS
jgi:hypothetical protein